MAMCLRCMLFGYVVATKVLRKRDLLRGRPAAGPEHGPELAAVININYDRRHVRG